MRWATGVRRSRQKGTSARELIGSVNNRRYGLVKDGAVQQLQLFIASLPSAFCNPALERHRISSEPGEPAAYTSPSSSDSLSLADLLCPEDDQFQLPRDEARLVAVLDHAATAGEDKADRKNRKSCKACEEGTQDGTNLLQGCRQPRTLERPRGLSGCTNCVLKGRPCSLARRKYLLSTSPFVANLLGWKLLFVARFPTQMAAVQNILGGDRSVLKPRRSARDQSTHSKVQDRSLWATGPSEPYHCKCKVLSRLLHANCLKAKTVHACRPSHGLLQASSDDAVTRQTSASQPDIPRDPVTHTNPRSPRQESKATPADEHCAKEGGVEMANGVSSAGLQEHGSSLQDPALCTETTAALFPVAMKDREGESGLLTAAASAATDTTTGISKTGSSNGATSAPGSGSQLSIGSKDGDGCITGELGGHMLEEMAAASGDGEHSLQPGGDEVTSTGASLSYSEPPALPEAPATRQVLRPAAPLGPSGPWIAWITGARGPMPTMPMANKQMRW